MKLNRITSAVRAVAYGIGEALHARLFTHMARTGLVLFEGEFNPAELKAELKKIGDQVKEAGERAIAEAKKSGDMSAEMKPRVDELLVQQGALQARLLDLEQRQARATHEEIAAVLTAGASLTGAESFKEWVKNGGMKSTQSGFVHATPRASLTSVPVTTTTTLGVPPDMVPGIFPLAQRRLTVRDLLTPGTTESNLIQYVKETRFTNNAAIVTEGALKPESSITFGLTQSAVVTIAHWIKASKQILDDFKALQSNIDGRLRYGLALVEENQLLKGSGVGNNLNGIYTQATAYSAPIVVSGATAIDVLRLMLLQAELAEYPSTGMVLHPADWAAIELLKETGTGAYVFANPQSLAQPALWGRPIVTTQAMTIDTALVGAFRMGAQIFDREDANVVISSENQDDFIRNMLTIRCEERLALAVYRPEAFIKNTNLP